MRDSDIVTLYLDAKKTLDRMGYEVDHSMGGFSVLRKGRASPNVRNIVIFSNAESLAAFARGIHAERSKAKKKTAKKKKRK